MAKRKEKAVVKIEEKLNKLQDNSMQQALSRILEAKSYIEQKLATNDVSQEDKQLTYDIMKDIISNSTREHSFSDYSMESIDPLQTLTDLCDALSNNNLEKLDTINFSNTTSLAQKGLSVLNSIIYPRHPFDDNITQTKLQKLNAKLLPENKINFKNNIEAQEALKYFFNEYYEYIDINTDIPLFSELFTEPTQVEQFIETYLMGE